MEKNWKQLPDEAVISQTVKNLEERGMVVHVVETKEEALKKLKEIIPANAEVMTGTSTTLGDIGFSDYLKDGEHQYNYLSPKIWAEPDQQKRANLRRKAVTAEYFLGSVNAISKNGEMIAVDSTGSRVGAYPFAAGKVIIVSGINKIVDSLEEGMQRVREYVFPLENERAKIAYGSPSKFGKWVIIEKEGEKERIHVVLVKEALGY